MKNTFQIFHLWYAFSNICLYGFSLALLKKKIQNDSMVCRSGGGRDFQCPPRHAKGGAEFNCFVFLVTYSWWILTILSEGQQLSATPPGLSGAINYDVLSSAWSLRWAWLCIISPTHPLTQHSGRRGHMTPSKRNQSSFTRLPPGPELEDHVICRCHWPSFSPRKELSCGWNQR